MSTPTAKPPLLDRDAAILICSRGREAWLSRLIGDLERDFLPALSGAGLDACVFVYAQGYATTAVDNLQNEFADAIAAGRLVIVTSERPHARIGDVVHAAIEALHARCRYRLAMLMDDDSVYGPDPASDANLRAAARRFIDEGHRAYSIKLGTGHDLVYAPFVEPSGPIMPFKEKMLWASRGVLDEVLALPRFSELSIGEDAVMSAVAWLPAPEKCLAVYGVAGFLHLGYERSEEFPEGEIAGGFAELTRPAGAPPDASHDKWEAALRHGVNPHHILPEVFVGPDHPHCIYNGVRAEVIARMRERGLLPAAEPAAAT